jgi:hypothetical protein
VDLDMNVDVTVEPTDTEGNVEPDGAGDRGLPPWRRFVITVFVVATLGAVLVQNMPDSAIKGGLMAAARPYLNATGLDQTWSIFSPNPRQETAYILARVERADGSVVFRPIPTGIGASEYWGYRWQKYGESLFEVGDPTLWREYAAWVVGQDQREGGHPVRVTLLRRAASNQPPGSEPDALPFVDQDFYTAAVTTR